MQNIIAHKIFIFLKLNPSPDNTRFHKFTNRYLSKNTKSMIIGYLDIQTISLHFSNIILKYLINSCIAKQEASTNFNNLYKIRM